VPVARAGAPAPAAQSAVTRFPLRCLRAAAPSCCCCRRRRDRCGGGRRAALRVWHPQRGGVVRLAGVECPLLRAMARSNAPPRFSTLALRAPLSVRPAVLRLRCPSLRRVLLASLRLRGQSTGPSPSGALRDVHLPQQENRHSQWRQAPLLPVELRAGFLCPVSLACASAPGAATCPLARAPTQLHTTWQGWIACGGEGGLLKVLKLESQGTGRERGIAGRCVHAVCACCVCVCVCVCVCHSLSLWSIARAALPACVCVCLSVCGPAGWNAGKFVRMHVNVVVVFSTIPYTRVM